MSTKIFTRKRIFSFLCVFAAIVVGVSAWKALAFANAKSVGRAKSYYFLLLGEDNVEVGAEFAQLDGGAGYVLERGGQAYAALSVYENERDGRSVQEALRNRGEETTLVRVGDSPLFFRGKYKAKAGFYINALRLLEEYISVLNGCIAKLEKGMTQESCKRLLTILKKQLTHAAGKYGEYEDFARICNQSAKRLAEICEKTVFLKDLRYVLCWQADNYVRLSAAFSR